MGLSSERDKRRVSATLKIYGREGQKISDDNDPVFYFLRKIFFFREYIYIFFFGLVWVVWCGVKPNPYWKKKKILWSDEDKFGLAGPLKILIIACQANGHSVPFIRFLFFLVEFVHGGPRAHSLVRANGTGPSK